MAQTQFEIIETIFQFPTSDNAMYRKELNLIRWFGKEPKLDIRGWNEDHTKMTKGAILNKEEMKQISLAALEHIKHLEGK